MSADIQEQYDALWAGAWGDMQRFGPVHRRQREALLKLIATLNVKTVLDVGCGSGENLAGLAEAFPNLALTGVDFSAEALAIAAKRAPSSKLQKLDAQSECLNERFDLVMSIQVIEHVPDDVAALRNMGKMSKQWILATSMRGRMRRSERSIGHLRNYSDKELCDKAKMAGLEVVDIFGWGFPFYSPLYRTVVEWLPGGVPQGKVGSKQIIFANLLYKLYGLNLPRHGDVVTMLARPALDSAPPERS
jgi:SAM-dependent methyltransferase